MKSQSPAATGDDCNFTFQAEDVSKVLELDVRLCTAHLLFFCKGKELLCRGGFNLEDEYEYGEMVRCRYSFRSSHALVYFLIDDGIQLRHPSIPFLDPRQKVEEPRHLQARRY